MLAAWYGLMTYSYTFDTERMVLLLISCTFILDVLSRDMVIV
jgi:hypothetical protein